jgi:hypothetical protein
MSLRQIISSSLRLEIELIRRTSKAFSGVDHHEVRTIPNMTPYEERA